MGKIQIANAPCSWGALEFDLEGKALGYEQVLDEMRETGYAGTELGDWGFMPTDPSELHAVIEARSFQLLGAFVPVALANESAHQEGLEKALKVASLMKSAGYPDAFVVLADEKPALAFCPSHGNGVRHPSRPLSSGHRKMPKGSCKSSNGISASVRPSSSP